MKKDNIIGYVGGIITIIATCFAVYFYFDKEYAHAKDFQLLQQRVDCIVLNQQYSSVRDRIWKLEDRYEAECKQSPDSVKEEYRKLIDEKKQLDNLLENCLDKK